MNSSLQTPIADQSAISSLSSHRAVKQLVAAVQELSSAHDMETIMAIVPAAARKLTLADGASLVLRDQEQCFYADEDAIAPLWKGQRFSIQNYIGGWTMIHRQPCMIADTHRDNRFPLAAYQSTFVKSLAMVPMQTAAPLGAIGVYWAVPQKPTAEAVELLQALAGATVLALERVQTQAELEQRVKRRTAALESVIARLQVEMLERQAAEAEMQKVSITDELTGLHNRRGFLLIAEQKLQRAYRLNTPACLLFIDLDGLKQVNDCYGHKAGDHLLIAAGKVLHQTFRESDVVARLGGDEFAVFVSGCTQANQIIERLQANIKTFNQTCANSYQLSMSVGVARQPLDQETSIEQMMLQADALMYAHKQSKRAVAG